MVNPQKPGIAFWMPGFLCARQTANCFRISASRSIHSLFSLASSFPPEGPTLSAVSYIQQFHPQANWVMKERPFASSWIVSNENII